MSTKILTYHQSSQSPQPYSVNVLLYVFRTRKPDIKYAGLALSAITVSHPHKIHHTEVDFATRTALRNTPLDTHQPTITQQQTGKTLLKYYLHKIKASVTAACDCGLDGNRT